MPPLEATSWQSIACHVDLGRTKMPLFCHATTYVRRTPAKGELRRRPAGRRGFCTSDFEARAQMDVAHVM
jgi:hypothetical protein